jgi:hypothetical protein
MVSQMDSVALRSNIVLHKKKEEEENMLATQYLTEAEWQVQSNR